MKTYRKMLWMLFGVVLSSSLLACAKKTRPSTCEIDPNLVQYLKFCTKPEHAQNSDIARCLRNLRLDINLDNVRKEELLKQILAHCSHP